MIQPLQCVGERSRARLGSQASQLRAGVPQQFVHGSFNVFDPNLIERDLKLNMKQWVVKSGTSHSNLCFLSYDIMCRPYRRRLPGLSAWPEGQSAARTRECTTDSVNWR